MKFRSSSELLCAFRRFGSHLVVIFIITKLLYIFNSIAQFYLLNHLLFDDFSKYGLSLLDDEVTALDNAFPKVVLCDMEVRRLGKISDT